MSTIEEFEALQEEKRERWVRDLPNRGLWGGNPVPRGEIRGSYRIMPESPMDLPIIQGTLGSVQSLDAPGLVEDLRLKNSRGIVERIFTKSD